MLPTGKIVVIFGGSGAIGSVVAQTMIREGTYVCLGARSQEKLGRTASVIQTAGGTVETFITGVFDEHNASKEVIRLAQQTGGIDAMVNTTGFTHEQGKHLDVLSLFELMSSITSFLPVQFNIAKTVTPYIGGNHAGITLSVIAPAAPMAMPDHLGHTVGCAGTEAFIKMLADKVGPANTRVVGACSHAIANAVAAGSYTGEIFSIKAQSIGLTVDQWLGGAAQSTMLAHLPTFA